MCQQPLTLKPKPLNPKPLNPKPKEDGKLRSLSGLDGEDLPRTHTYNLLSPNVLLLWVKITHYYG